MFRKAYVMPSGLAQYWSWAALGRYVPAWSLGLFRKTAGKKSEARVASSRATEYDEELMSRFSFFCLMGRTLNNGTGFYLSMLKFKANVSILSHHVRQRWKHLALKGHLQAVMKFGDEYQ
jgi:hypothetical protein